jgi:molybdate transport system substrate-binding protein
MRAGLTLIAASLLVAGCGTSEGDERDLTVFAASSLTDVLPELNDAYEAQTGSAVTLVFGGSNHLAAQLRDGAPADAFLTADLDLFPDGTTGLRFASNRLVLAVPAGNPAGISGPDALADERLRVAVCAVEVPCGRATRALGIPLAPDTEETSVRAVLSRVSLGEADVGVVYATDAASEPGVEVVWPDAPSCPCVEYHAVPLTPAGDRFVAFLASETAVGILRNNGFSE